MECFNLLELFDYLQNTMPSRQRAQIKAHLVECLDCHKSLRWLKLVQTTAAEDQSFDFPEEVIGSIVAQFKALTATDPPQTRRLVASLIFDTFLSPEFAIARGTTAAPKNRQVLYQAEGYEIDLRFELSDENDDEELIGQVVPKDWDATELKQFNVQLLQEGSVVSAASTNAQGVFKIPNLISGTYDLKVSVPDGEISLEQVSTARYF